MSIDAHRVAAAVRPNADLPPSASRLRPVLASGRLMSIDAYRGLVMFLLLAEVLELCQVARAIPDSRFWGFLCYHQSHAAWIGCHLHDLIQPGFTFLVGVSLAFSIAKRQARGDSFAAMASHAAVRSLTLILLGMVMRSIHPRELVLTFEDTLSQIGLGYFFLFLLALRGPRVWWTTFGLILLGYWLAFALYPLPSPLFDYASAGVTADWLRENGLTGWQAHWQKNSNVAAAFDAWLLNSFPRSTPYVSTAGLATLNFIPTIATMILGLVAGHILRSDREPLAKLSRLLLAAAAGLVTGAFLGWSGICPIVKAIWTPSWVLFSGGWCFLFMALFYYCVDLRGTTSRGVPARSSWHELHLCVCADERLPGVRIRGIRRIVGEAPFQMLGSAYQPLVYGLTIVVWYWLVLYALYRARWFVRI